MTKTLTEELDAAAVNLLSRVRTDDTVDQSAVDPEVRKEKRELLIEQVKAFEAVVRWADIKHKVTPPPPPPAKEESKFDQLRGQWHGDQGGGRGSPARKAKAGREKQPDAGPGAAQPEPQSDPAVDDDDGEVRIEDL